MNGHGLVGHLVKWGHLAVDGTRMLKQTGVIVAANPGIGGNFNILVKDGDGKLFVWEHKDVLVGPNPDLTEQVAINLFLEKEPELEIFPGPYVSDPLDLEGQLSLIQTALDKYGFMADSIIFKDLPVNTTNTRAIFVIDALVKDLEEAEAQVLTLSEKKKLGRPKKDA